MEPLRVLELYSGIGGMHQALRGERAHPVSLSFRALGLVPAWALGRGQVARSRGRRQERGVWGGVGGRSVVMETALARSPRLAAPGGDSLPPAPRLVRRAGAGFVWNQCVSPDPGRRGWKGKLRWYRRRGMGEPLAGASPQF